MFRITRLYFKRSTTPQNSWPKATRNLTSCLFCRSSIVAAVSLSTIIMFLLHNSSMKFSSMLTVRFPFYLTIYLAYTCILGIQRVSLIRQTVLTFPGHLTLLSVDEGSCFSYSMFYSPFFHKNGLMTLDLRTLVHLLVFYPCHNCFRWSS